MIPTPMVICARILHRRDGGGGVGGGGSSGWRVAGESPLGEARLSSWEDCERRQTAFQN